jgi:hypothetical protein
MTANPEPEETVLDFSTYAAVEKPDAYRKESTDAFEVQGWMPGVTFQKSEVFICQTADGIR